MHNILDLQARSRRQIKKPAPMYLVSPEKLRKIATSLRGASVGLHVSVYMSSLVLGLLSAFAEPLCSCKPSDAPVNQASIFLPTKPQHSRAPIPPLGFLVYL